MIYAFIIAFIVLLRLNIMVFKSIVAPASLFVAMWTATLIALALCGNLFYPLSVDTLTVYLVGGLAFSAGAILAITVSRSHKRPAYAISADRHHYCRLLLDLGLVICLVGLPWFAHKMLDPVGGLDNPTALLEVRARAVESSGHASSFSLLNNLAVLARFVAFGMFLEYDTSKSRRWRSYLSLLPAFAYGLLEGSKGPVVMVLLTGMFILFLKHRQVKLKTAVVSVVLCLVCFSFGLLYINFGYMDFSNTNHAWDTVAWVVPSYWLGGPVAFERIVQDPYSVPSTQNINRFFLETANSLGAQFDVPSRHAEFTDVSTNNISSDTNVYTIYFSYYKDYGWLGMVGLMLLAGLCVTLLYQSALRMGPVSIVLCAMALVGTIFSFNAEHYWLELNEYIKAGLFFSVLYHAPLVRFRSPHGFSMWLLPLPAPSHLLPS